MKPEDIRQASASRLRARALGIVPGDIPAGALNAITDVPGVLVGHVTLIEGKNIRTGATALLPHPGNLFQEKVPAGLSVSNGFGKLTGSTQLRELGELETPLILTNTLSVPRAADAILDWTLSYPGNQGVYSVNPVVGETNDGWLNDIRARAITSDLVTQAIRSASAGAVEEGVVGAGTGTICFGWKGGIGTSSRRLPEEEGGYHLGVLVQTNYGGSLRILGTLVGARLNPPDRTDPPPRDQPGSIMIVLATDAPLSDRNLARLARRTFGGLARTGADLSNGSGDYALAFSTAEAVRRTASRRTQPMKLTELPNQALDPLFRATIEATEEAIYNSLFKAVTLRGFRGRVAPALPVEQLLSLLNRDNPGNIGVEIL
ncbi:MAG TPA: P1 family peptidase [Anaerolineales bacterium]|nr:P1 family peptidase [Anaerolineales bacterium]